MRYLGVLLATVAAAQSNPDIILNHTFETEASGWTSLGQGASVRLAHDPAQVHDGTGALAFTYEVQPRRTAVAVLQASSAFAAMARLRFWVRADHDTTLAALLAEKKPGGGNYLAWFYAPADVWQQIELAPSDFILGDGPQDPVDSDGKLDLDALQGVGILDLASFVAGMTENPDIPVTIDRASGTHTLLVDDFQVLASPAPRHAGIDRFDRGFLQWMTLGGMQLKLSAAGNPLEGPALQATYRQTGGEYQVLVRRLANLDLSRATHLAFDIASEHEITLVVSLEVKKPGAPQGPRYSLTICPPGGREVFHVNLKLADFEGPGKLDPAQLKSILLADVTGAEQPNTVWIGNVEAQ